MKKPSLNEFKAWSKRNRHVAVEVIRARAFAEVERARVDAYIAPIFASYEFHVSEEMAARRGSRERITEVKNLYLTDLEAPEYKNFLADCDAAHVAHGFKGKAGQCPALVAETLRITAENALVTSVSDFFGTDFSVCFGEDRKQLIEMCLGACLEREAA